MQNSAWMGLLRVIPSDQHDKLILVTQNQTEINLQGILRMEKDYVVLQGRLAASTEAGRVFFIPYDQLSHLCFREGMTEAQVLALLGPATAPLAETAEEKSSEPSVPTQPEAASAPAQPPLSQESVRPGAQAQPPGKAALLERLRRSRSAPEAPKSPGH